MTPAARFGVAADWHPVGGGFSGAAVFAGRVAGEPVFALKGYPPGVSRGRVEQVHRWMTAAAGTGLVPRVHSTPAGDSTVEHAGRVWELLAWLPGRRDPSRLIEACAAVARLHRAWRPLEVTLPFPAVARRLAALTDPRPVPATPYADATAVARLAAASARELAPSAGRVVAAHPCLCDVHADHVLFDPPGVIDYAAMKFDHPAVDLARLLDDSPDRDAGLAAYHAAGGSAGVTAELVDLLGRTGAVCGVLHWLRRAGERALTPAEGERVRRLARQAGVG